MGAQGCAIVPHHGPDASTRRGFVIYWQKMISLPDRPCRDEYVPQRPMPVRRTEPAARRCFPGRKDAAAPRLTLGMSAEGGKMKHQTNNKLALAVLSFSLLSSASAFAQIDRSQGVDGLGWGGIHAMARADMTQADQYYWSEYVAHPGEPLAIFNWARSLNRRGHLDEANRFYSQAAAVGQNYIPDHLLERSATVVTIRDAACMHLAENRKADPNCPGFRAEAPAAPYPMVSQAAPAPAVAVRNFTVFFDFDKSDLTLEARQIIASAVETAKRTGPVRITVTGHTDTVGSQAYNQRLSERRAEAVKSEMVRLGMNSVDIATIGRSFNDPLVPTGPGVREAQNRRAVIDFGPPAVARN